MDDSLGHERVAGWPLLAPARSGSAAGAKTPTFSIIIAAYNAAGYVGAAIESALEQSTPAHQIVICDDASTDDTARVVESYGSDVLLRRAEVNRGCASARNEAIKAASGDFIVVLDADDRFLPKRIEALGNVLRERPDLDILTTDATVEVDGRAVGRYYGTHWRFEVEDQRSEILRRNFVFIAAAARRELVMAAGGFDGSKRRTEDWDLWIRLIFGGSRVGCIDEPLAVYADRPDSVSADHARMVRSELHTLRKAERLSGLTAAERATLGLTIEMTEREVLRQDVRAAIADNSPDARRLSWKLARYPGTAAKTRLKAVVGAVAPSLVRWSYDRAGQADGNEGEAQD